MRLLADPSRPVCSAVLGAVLVLAPTVSSGQPKTATTTAVSVRPGASSAPAAPAAPTASPAAHDAIKETARDLYDRAVKAMSEQRWEDCRAAFLAAFNIHQSYQIAGNLAFCEMKLGQLADAADHVAFALRGMPADAPTDRRRGAESIQAAVRPKVAEVTVRVDKPDAEVQLDDRSIGRSPLAVAVFVDPGQRLVEARLLGKVASASLDAVAGGSHIVELRLPDETVTPPVVTRSAVPAFVLGGAALAALGVGIGLSVTAYEGDARTRALAGEISGSGGTCVAGAPNHDARCQDLMAGARAADAMSRAGVGLYIGAGALLTGAVLYTFWPGATPLKLSATALPSPSGPAGSVLLRGAF